MKVSVVIPTHNASDLIEGSVQDIIRTMDDFGLEYEVLLRDDGSIDNSREIMHAMDREHSRVRCFYNDANEGLGSTLRKLFGDAGGDHVIYCDCDLPFGAKIIPDLSEKLKNCDIAVASRYAGLPNNVRLFRRLVSRMYYGLCKGLFNISVGDIGSGSVGIGRGSLEKMNLSSKGFGVHAQMYIKAQQLGLSIIEYPAVSLRGRSRSFSVWKHGPGIVLETLLLWLSMIKTAAQNIPENEGSLCQAQKNC